MSTNFRPIVDDTAASPPGPEAVTPSTADNSRSVREFQAICAKHSLACGSPEDLAPFLRALGENKLLAMNFWSLTARLSDGRHGPALDPGQLLEAIVQGVTGQSVDQLRPSRGKLVDRLARILAGEDVSVGAEDYKPIPLPGKTPAAAAIAGSPVDSEAQRRSPPAPLFSRADTSRQRLVLEPPIFPVEPPAATHPSPVPSDQEPRITIPLSNYAEHDDEGKPARRMTTAVLVLALACGFGFLLLRGVAAWRQPGNTARDDASSFARNAAVDFHRLAASIRPAPSTSAATPVPPPPQEIPAMTAPSRPASPAGNASQDSPPQDAPAVAASSSPAPAHDTSASAASSRSEHAASEQGPDAVDSAAFDATLTAVPGSVMKQHLISSRFPIVPDAANADGVSGVVTLSAVVTARGTVEHVRAISGPIDLRQPAIDAVSAWRYRPYLLHSEPVNVSTTIAVDFSGND